jgi:hypothetical protein|tara:strand:+ start:203 stop:805 length:603 start_codon:yes stop_codon:yes gene_type:complete
MTTKRDSIVVYRSFYEAAKALTDKEELELYRAIFEFGLDHKTADMGPMAAAMFKLIKPQLEANYKKWQNGMRGGRPKQEESKDKPKDNQKETKDEPNENVNVNDNDNANVFIGLQLNDKSLFPIFDDDLDKWRDLYPAVNVEQELRNMVGWIDGNPTKRKTKSGIKKFINSWLSKEQDQGGRRQMPGQKLGLNLLKEAAR